MTFVFMVILLLNCLVIFATDALVANGSTTATSTTTIRTILPTAAAIDRAAELLSAGRSITESTGRVVARKGVDDQTSETVLRSMAQEPSIPATLDKSLTSAATTATVNSSSATTEIPIRTSSSGANLRADTSVVKPVGELVLDTKLPIVNQTAPATAQSSSSTIKSTESTSTTTTTTKQTTTTTTPTTVKPHKPKITYNVENDPNRVISLDEPAPSNLDAPRSQPSREYEVDADLDAGRRYIIPVVTLLFAIPMVLAFGIVATRRFKSYWATRHYRRMDFLVDGMYNT